MRLLPVRLRLTNQLDATLSTTLEFSLGGAWDVRSESTLPVTLEPGEERELEVLVPFFGEQFGESVRLRASHRGVSVSETIHRIESGSANRSAAPFLVVTSAGFQQAQQFQALTIGLGAGSGQGVSFTRSTVAAGVIAEDLSSDWRAYSTLMFVAIDLNAPLPGRAAMDALAKWTELGGNLIFFGGPRSRADDLLAASGVRLQDRLQLEANQVGQVYRHGFGRITLYSELGFAESFGAKHLGLLAGSSDGPFPSLFYRAPPALPGVGLPPLNLLTAALILVALIMGPIQFAQMKKRNAKPWRFLQTTPLLGLGFAVVILMVSLLSQGLGVRESVQSVTWLDQERRTASTVATRTSFSGSLFAQTQRYGAEAAVIPSPYTADNLREPRFLVDLAAGGALRGAFLPTRVPASSAVSAHAAARSGLRLEKEGDTLYAVNDLDVPLQRLRLVDNEGRSFQPQDADVEIGAGERVQLIETEALFDVRLRHATAHAPIELISGLDEVKDDGLGFNSLALRHLPPVLPRRAWMAEVKRSPFLPDGGVSRKEEHAVHLILGLMEERP